MEQGVPESWVLTEEGEGGTVLAILEAMYGEVTQLLVAVVLGISGAICQWQNSTSKALSS